MLELNVFMTKQPLIDKGAERVFNLSRRPRSEWEIQREIFDQPSWLSRDPDSVEYKGTPLILDTHQTRYIYSIGPVEHTQGRDSLQARARRRKIDIPEPFLEKLKRDDFIAVADEEMHALLEEFPYLERLYSSKLFWGVLRFSEGKPIYSASVESVMGRSNEGFHRMVCLARVLAAKYQGIIYEEIGATFEKPDLEALSGIDINSWEALAEFYT